jgi:hypothetical protein
VLSAVPAVYGAQCLVDELVLRPPRLVVALDGTRSIGLAPSDFVRVTKARIGRFVGTTRLLPAGGMVEDDPYRGHLYKNQGEDPGQPASTSPIR